MKFSILFTTFLLTYVTPTAFGKSELELLRQRCAEQERQIRLLEEENLKLRLLGERYRPATATTTNNAPATPSLRPSSPGPASYTIRPGDSLERIARRHNTTAAVLVRLNQIQDPLKIQPGQTLKLPEATQAPATVSSPAPAAAAAASAASAPTTVARPAATGTHTVAPGETLYSIGKKHGVSVNHLLAANPGVNPNTLRPGQRLQLGSTATAATSKPATPAPKPAASQLSSTAAVPVSNAQPAASAQAKPAAPPLPPVPNPTPPAEASGSRLMKIHHVTTYGEFASAHGTNVERLNELNDLDLTRSTVLAIGSELYAPAQP
jgi:LysM repeat protein